MVPLFYDGEASARLEAGFAAALKFTAVAAVTDVQQGGIRTGACFGSALAGRLVSRR